MHLAIDSTGLKVTGEGEWKLRTDNADKRRIWVKLHLAVDTTSAEILAHSPTPSARQHGQELPGLFDAVEGRSRPSMATGLTTASPATRPSARAARDP